MRTALDVHGQLLIKLQPDPNSNSSWVGYIEDPRRHQSDDIGALYYVVAVIFIYGLSIVMMIASHVRKNKQDSQLRTYLKEMASLRKSDRRDKILSTLTGFANRKEVQDVLQTKEKLQRERKKDTTDTEGENGEADPTQNLIKTPAGNNDDSVFLPHDFCIPGRDRPPKSATNPRNSDSSSGVLYSFSSGVGSPVTSSGYPGSEARTPTTPDLRYSERVAYNKRSPSFHDYRRWKMMETRSPGYDGKAFRFGDRPSPSHSEHKTISHQPESRSPSLNDFRLSPLCGRSLPSVNETRTIKWMASKPVGQSEVRFHTILDNPPSLPPASIEIVDEDAVL